MKISKQYSIQQLWGNSRIKGEITKKHGDKWKYDVLKSMEYAAMEIYEEEVYRNTGILWIWCGFDSRPQ